VFGLCRAGPIGDEQLVDEDNRRSRDAGDDVLPRVLRAFVPHRFLILAVWDSISWIAALWLSAWVRYEFEWRNLDIAGLFACMPLVVGIQLIAGWWQGLYKGRWHLGSFEEIAGLLRSVAAAMVVLFFVNLPLRWIPISVPVISAFVVLVEMAAIRYAWRLAIEQRKRPTSERATRALVFGAGEGASQLITATLRDPDSPYLPVAILDDDPGKQHLRLRGIRVQGTRQDIAAIAEQSEAEVLLIAIPSASSTLIRELFDISAAAGLGVAALPPVRELLGSGVAVADVRPLTDADLLGRHAVDTDVASIAGYLRGKVVLVTGAGGSIGSELCRQIQSFEPAELVLVDHDESAIHACQLTLDGRGQLDTPNLVVANIRDRNRMREIFARWRPHVVFHAAALKHVPLLEMHPEEAVKTNVWGTHNVLEAAASVDVERFVNISTDKAADPINMLGRTKRVAEQLTAGVAASASGRYLSVRFGNVLGSRGSVLMAFRSQIASGGPVTVTHPDVTRYFMTVQEAVQLVIQAGAIGGDGEVLVLDMGEPVRIAEVAERMVAASPRDIDIIYTGLRPGEKVHEVLFGSGEDDERPFHPLISHVSVPPMSAPPALEELTF
jgi:FlaA1/EpsC-like NDP-sugar epimerase